MQPQGPFGIVDLKPGVVKVLPPPEVAWSPGTSCFGSTIAAWSQHTSVQVLPLKSRTDRAAVNTNVADGAGAGGDSGGMGTLHRSRFPSHYRRSDSLEVGVDISRRLHVTGRTQIPPNDKEPRAKTEFRRRGVVAEIISLDSGVESIAVLFDPGSRAVQ